MLAQVILFEGFDLLDVIAPYEVLHAGGDASGGQLEVELVALEGAGAVKSGTGGVTLSAVGPIDLARADLLILPGASGKVADIPVVLAATAQTPLSSVMAEALRRPDVTVTTVCGGSLVLAMAGLLEGRCAVTHHQGLALLEATGSTVIKARVVDDGDLITAGGVTSGLDLGLYVLERFLGPRVALEVEQLFEYERRGTVWRHQGLEPVAV